MEKKLLIAICALTVANIGVTIYEARITRRCVFLNTNKGMVYRSDYEKKTCNYSK